MKTIKVQPDFMTLMDTLNTLELTAIVAVIGATALAWVFAEKGGV